jgi:ribonucleoside-triphosphate reductase
LKALIGKHHGESEEARKLGLKIIGRIREKCDQYKKQYKMNFSCYATPAEGLSGKFTKLDKIIFGNEP